jgi:predicted dehydrogenase/nucleoside-diphosphate-sugar epimerase
MSNRPIKVGMVGAGFILKPHALAVAGLDGVILQAVADTSLPRAEDAARQFGFAHAFGSVHEIAGSDCDVVHVLVPPFLHVEIAEKLLNAGKSVFVEKPMGLSGAECRRLGALADAKGLRLGVNHNFLFLPGYERLRSAVRDGEIGRLDQISCSWHYELPQLSGGPFDVWMLSAPANLFFEIGPHLAGFILDLAGDVKTAAAVANRPVDLPTGQRAFRSWSVIGEGERANFTLSLSIKRGQEDRLVRVRGSGGSAQLDFGRDIYWEERAGSANPIFDSFAIAKSIGRQASRLAQVGRRRRIVAALRRSLDSAPFSESMVRSIARFYVTADVDERHHWSFGARVIEFCEEVTRQAGARAPSSRPVAVAPTRKKLPARPTVLVVGGTGFIGRRLVEKLVANGVGVRVLSRSKASAAIALKGVPVDIHQGSHGSRETVRAALQGIDTVYHLAKCEGQKWDDYVRCDIEPTRVLGEAAAAVGVKRFIYTGTIDSYDSSSSARRITEETPLDARIARRNLYARSKAACEALLGELGRDRGLPLIVMRPGIVIGEGAGPQHLGVAHFMSDTDVNYWGEGANKLPLVLVDDVAEALMKAMDAPGAVGGTFLLTSPPLLSARDYVAEVSARSGIKARAAPHAASRYWLSDFVKELAKNVIRHPNRRWPSLHDWRCRAHVSVYDSSLTQEVLGWRPASDRETLVKAGIHGPVDATSA